MSSTRHGAAPAGMVAVLLALVGACASPGADSAATTLPPGPGLVTSDRTPPDGAAVHEAPVWNEGDRFVYRKAGRTLLPLRVVADGEHGPRMRDEGSGRALHVGPEQVQRGQLGPDGELEFELDPGDHLVSWPLWVGKRWTSEFVSRAHGRSDLPMVATYLCDGAEAVTVGAGTFECLRIWRRLRPAVEGDFPERVALLWYSPEAGNFVRRLEDGLLTELVEYHRQR